jgi:hypothetical protein
MFNVVDFQSFSKDIQEGAEEHPEEVEKMREYSQTEVSHAA